MQLAARSTARAAARSAAPVRAVVARPALRMRQVSWADEQGQAPFAPLKRRERFFFCR
jgi:hypothetical protein